MPVVAVATNKERVMLLQATPNPDYMRKIT